MSFDSNEEEFNLYGVLVDEEKESNETFEIASDNFSFDSSEEMLDESIA